MVLTLNLSAEQALNLQASTPRASGHHSVSPDPQIAGPNHRTRLDSILRHSGDSLEFLWTPPATMEVSVGASERDLYNWTLDGQGNTSSVSLDNVTKSPLDDGINKELKKAEIGLLAAILYLALFGNGIVLLVLRLRRQKLSRMQWFIAHLAIADVFVAFFNVLPQLMWDINTNFYGNNFLCKSVTYFQLVAMYASSWVLVMAAVDRYVSICHPLTSQTLTPKRVHLMISLAWTLSLVFSLPQFFIFSYTDPYGEGFTCHASFVDGWGLKAYVVWVFLSDYAVPFIILTFCYGRICHVVWLSVGSKESHIVRGGHGHSSMGGSSAHGATSSRTRTAVTVPVSEARRVRAYQRGVSRSKIKTIKLTLTVVLCYLICWAPYFFVQLFSVFGGEAYLEHPAVVLLMLMASLNSCSNPWIYLAFSSYNCPRVQQVRRVSRSWNASTHVTSAADSIHSHDRDSQHRHSQLGARSSNMSGNSASCHHGNATRNNRRLKSEKLIASRTRTLSQSPPLQTEHPDKIKIGIEKTCLASLQRIDHVTLQLSM
ncbi:hypothetical protein EGW08_019655 [Elysia chlorotica]|uniref:G-protein coupled receptors family 1 profile domain-containing protein n=1 Tax=Elysia chlorotica TaxID=188477 RepID=A0A3S0Z9K1_ELYCH|nr:hypothetical protein EGW08_019655 [Elysia chlorotica]